MAEYIDEYLAEEDTCKDCIHKEACDAWVRHGATLYDDYHYSVEGCTFHTPAAEVVEVDKVAEMLRLMFDDDCACNYNGNDEWLPEKCKYAVTDCPMPKERLGCWKEFVKAFLAKMDGGERG